GNEELRLEGFSGIGLDDPALSVLVVMGLVNAGVELDVLAKVEPVCHKMQPLLYLFLPGIAFAPAPLLVQRFGEEVLVDVGLGIKARARITIPVPGAAHIGSGFKCANGKTLFAQAMNLIKAGHTRADDNGVVRRHTCVPGTVER